MSRARRGGGLPQQCSRSSARNRSRAPNRNIEPLGMLRPARDVQGSAKRSARVCETSPNSLENGRKRLHGAGWSPGKSVWTPDTHYLVQRHGVRGRCLKFAEAWRLVARFTLATRQAATRHRPMCRWSSRPNSAEMQAAVQGHAFQLVGGACV